GYRKPCDSAVTGNDSITSARLDGDSAVAFEPRPALCYDLTPMTVVTPSSDSATATFADERAALGNPSFVWRFGQDRRLDLIRHYVPLEGRRILDVGCGIGTYVKQLRRFSDAVYGFDVAADRVRRGARDVPNLMLAEGEHLPFGDGSFDIVILNEV